MAKQKSPTSRETLDSVAAIDKGVLKLNREYEEATKELDIKQMRVELWVSNKLDMEYEYLDGSFQSIKKIALKDLGRKNVDVEKLEKINSYISINGSIALRVLINNMKDCLKEGLVSNIRYQFYKRAYDMADKITLEMMLAVNKKQVQLKMGPGVSMELLQDALGELKDLYIPKAKEQALSNRKQTTK